MKDEQQVKPADDDALFEEMRELMKIPLMRSLMVSRFEELKYLLQGDIARFREIKQRLQPPQESNRAEPTVFQLQKLGKKTWVPSLKGSFHEIKKNTTEELLVLFPRLLIDYVVEQVPAPGMEVSRTGFSLDALPDRVFTFCFKRESETKISGFLSEAGVTDNSIPFPRKGKRVTDNWVDMQTLNTLFNYLLENKTLYQHMALQFTFVWKLLIDQQES